MHSYIGVQRISWEYAIEVVAANHVQIIAIPINRFCGSY
jgi:hypothetical protein